MPASQLVQVLAEAAEYWPAAQEVQLDEPVLAAYVPAVHATQAIRDDPLAAREVPASQLKHLAPPLSTW